MSTETMPDISAVPAAVPLILPIGQQVGARFQTGQLVVAQQVRCGGKFHDLTERQAEVWQLAHGVPEEIDGQTPWQRSSVEQRLAGGGAIIDELTGLGLLVEVTPGTAEAAEFARAHRLVPLMLGLGNSANDPDTFGIGFLSQPVLQVSHAIYDVWQWSTMDDSLWNTCENATDVARRAGSTDPEAIETERLLTGILGSLHALLASSAGYLDIGFQLNWPAGTTS
ncbi:MAG TPA: hypothetical protein VHX59_26960 [Mycobacteriales bacterium]|nr:hypothetical protein [Mycobacteriales bacterium]